MAATLKLFSKAILPINKLNQEFGPKNLWENIFLINPSTLTQKQPLFWFYTKRESC